MWESRNSDPKGEILKFQLWGSAQPLEQQKAGSLEWFMGHLPSQGSCDAKSALDFHAGIWPMESRLYWDSFGCVDGFGSGCVWSQLGALSKAISQIPEELDGVIL